MPPKLSEILALRTDFNFFKAAANLEPFDLRRLETVVEELLRYITQLQLIFNEIDFTGRLDFEWLSEGRNRFYEIYRNVESVDSIVLQCLNLLETHFNDDMKDTMVFDTLETLSQTSLELKRDHLLPLKNRLDISVEYNDIYNLTMNSINTEMENCLKKCFKIHEKRFSSPVRHAPTFNLEMLTKKLLQQRNQLKLPLLNEIDNELYEEYLDLKTVVDPLKESLKFIPLRIDDFKKKYAESNVADTQKMVEKYEALVKEMQYLQSEVNDLKYELVDKRWSEIFSYLNTEMSFLISSVEKEVTKMEGLENDSVFKSQVFKRVKYTTNIVENTFILINQAIDEKLIDVNVMEKSNELADAWLSVKGKIPGDIIAKIDIDDEVNDTNDDDDTMTQNFKKLSLDSRRVSGDRSMDSDTSRSGKRKSRHGQFLLNKMNLKTIIIESDPTSVRKPEELHAQRVLADSVKHNQLESTPSKSKDPNNIIDTKKIPELKTALSDRSSNHSIRLSASSVRSHSSNISSSPEKVLSEEEEPVQTRKEMHEETLKQLLHGSPSAFETPMPSSKRHVSDSNAVLTQSKIPVLTTTKLNLENYKSRIPRPVSRIDGSRPASRLGEQRLSTQPRSTSSLGMRSVQRPCTSLALSRATKTDIGPSRIGLSNRHSMIPQTPVRNSMSSTTRRRSMLPQPTPVKELIEVGAKHTGRRSQLGSRSSSSLGSRAGSSLGERMGGVPPAKPVWR